MGILSMYDIQWMENTVKEIIDEWNTKINIYSKLPLEDQPNYNHLMKEFIGDSYCSVITINAERKDIVNNITNDPDPDSLDFGKKDNGTFLYAIHDIIDSNYYTPSLHDIVTIGDGHVYYIRSVRKRIGETLVTIKRFVGSKPIIIESNDGIIIKDYDWSGEND